MIPVPPQNQADGLSSSRIGFIGAGAVASTLARVLVERGVTIAAVSARRIAHAEALARHLPAGMAEAIPAIELVQRCDLVFLAVSDDQIEPLSQDLPWHSGQSLVHFSGAKSSAALGAAQSLGARVAALHPLMTFPYVELERPAAELLNRLRGCYWTLETEDTILAEQLRGLVAILSGHVLSLARGNRTPYHIGAVLASNYVVALVGAACTLFETLGIGREESLPALLPLVRATVDSLAELGIPRALSGPVARGDIGTVAAHLAWLQHGGEEATTEGVVPGTVAIAAPPIMESVGEAYGALAGIALLLAIEKGTVNQQQSAALRALLSPGG